MERIHTTDRFAQVAQQLRTAWRHGAGTSRFVAGPVSIDLATPQGRWELLVFAILAAARVQEHVVQCTWIALHEAGLLEPTRLANASRGDKMALKRILSQTYRALISKDAKADALMRGARHLLDQWGGDLNNIYHAHAGDDVALLEAIREFRQLHLGASWLCRVMQCHGQWPSVGPLATQHIDVHVRRVLLRLGMLEPASIWSEYRNACLHLIDTHFGGETAPLYLQGRELCQAEDVKVCQTRCSVYAWCVYRNPALGTEIP